MWYKYEDITIEDIENLTKHKCVAECNGDSKAIHIISDIEE